MSIKTFFVLAVTFAIGFVAGSIVTFKGIENKLQKEHERDDAEQGKQIGV